MCVNVSVFIFYLAASIILASIQLITKDIASLRQTNHRVSVTRGLLTALLLPFASFFVTCMEEQAQKMHLVH